MLAQRIIREFLEGWSLFGGTNTTQMTRPTDGVIQDDASVTSNQKWCFEGGFLMSFTPSILQPQRSSASHRRVDSTCSVARLRPSSVVLWKHSAPMGAVRKSGRHRSAPVERLLPKRPWRGGAGGFMWVHASSCLFQRFVFCFFFYNQWPNANLKHWSRV